MFRREFVKLSLVSTFLCYFGSKRIFAATKQIKEKNVTKSEIIKILGYAIFAPSSHNTQPWKVKIKDTKLEIYGDYKRVLKEVDSNNREWFLSISAFLFTIKYIANSLGYSINESYFLNNLEPNKPIFELDFLDREKSINKSKLNLVKLRSTSRFIYDKQNLTLDEINSIKRIDANCIYYFEKKSKQAETIAQYHINAFEQQSNIKKKQYELSCWLRFKKEDKEIKGDGIFPEMLALDKLASFFWYSFFNKKSVMSKSFIKKGIKAAKQQIDNCSGFIVITSIDSSNESLVKVGQLYQKVLLHLTQLNIKNHTISQILEEEPWQNTISKDLELSDSIQFIIRVGKSERKRYGNAIRRGIKDILI